MQPNTFNWLQWQTHGHFISLFQFFDISINVKVFFVTLLPSHAPNPLGALFVSSNFHGTASAKSYPRAVDFYNVSAANKTNGREIRIATAISPSHNTASCTIRRYRYVTQVCHASDYDWAILSRSKDYFSSSFFTCSAALGIFPFQSQSSEEHQPFSRRWSEYRSLN